MPKQDGACVQPECQDAQIPGSKYCFFHDLQQKRSKAGEKALRKGDMVGGLLNMAASFGAGLVAKELQQPDNINKARVMWHMHQQQQQAQQQGYQAPEHSDPFAMLGLDRNTATATDIRKMQQAMAKPLHPDKNPSKAAEDRLKEINEAAAACVEILKKS